MGRSSDGPGYRCGKGPPVGDRGQRYEVRGTPREGGEPEVVGWTEREDGGALAETVAKWPRYLGGSVFDRLLCRTVRRIESEVRNG